MRRAVSELGPAVETAVAKCPFCGRTENALVSRTRDYGYLTCSNDFDYVRCCACEQIYLHNRPTVSELDRIYPDNYTAHDLENQLGAVVSRLRDYVQLRKLNAFRKYLAPHDAILEVGPGSGDLLVVVRSHGEPSWSIVGVEMSPKGAALLRRKGIETLEQRFEEVKYAGPPVGAVIMNQVLEHLYEPRAAIAKAFSVLRPGGILFVETPSIEGWDARLVPLALWGGWHAPRHFQIYTEDSLARMMKSAGFSVDRVEYIYSPYLWAHTLQFTFRTLLRARFLEKFFDVGNPLAVSMTCLVDALQLAVRGKTSNMRVIGRKPFAHEGR
jgi:SAM-dependent methyltransferase